MFLNPIINRYICSVSSYLRELSEPLLTYTLHDEWVEAIKIQDRNDKLRKLWSAVNRLPKPNFTNLSYVVQFLALLSSRKAYNKMTANNIAIVIAPNLIWAKEDNSGDVLGNLGRNMTLGNLYRQIVEQLVEFPKYFFDNQIDFGVPESEPGPGPSPVLVENNVNGSATEVRQPPSYVTLPRQGHHRRNVSADLKIDMSLSGMNLDTGSAKFGECESPKQPQRRKKQAPLPPQGRMYDQTNYSSSSPEQPRSHMAAPRDPSNPRATPPFLQTTAKDSNFPTNSTPKFTPPRETLPATPVPAARLHHTGSIRRPNIEPPKPPGHTPKPTVPPSPSFAGGAVKAVPPRPQPPNISGLEKSSSPFELSTSSTHNEAKSTIAGGASELLNMSSSFESSTISSSMGVAVPSPDNNGSFVSVAPAISSSSRSGSDSSSSSNKYQEEHRQKKQHNVESPPDRPRAPVGFEHLDDDVEGSSNTSSLVLLRSNKLGYSSSGNSLDDLQDDNSSGSEIPSNNLSNSKIFRKSLETVIQQQASGQPLILPKHQLPESSTKSNLQSNANHSVMIGFEAEDLNANCGVGVAPCDISNSSENTPSRPIPPSTNCVLTPPVPAVRTIRENIQSGAPPEPSVSSSTIVFKHDISNFMFGVSDSRSFPSQ